MMNEKMIEKLAAKGFNRWTKGKYDRMYVNAKDLGLACEYYKTGNVHSATFQGEGISNSEAYRMKAAKTYIDVETGEVVSDNRYLKEAAEEVLEAVKAEIEAEEAALNQNVNFEEAAEIAAKIREADTWGADDCRELCDLAGIADEWDAADGETFESVVYKAANILGVEI